MTKFHKIVIIASALGLLTYFLPIVEGNGVQFSLSNQIVSEYTHNRGWIIKIPFVVTLIIALVGNTKFVFGKIKSIFFILLGLLAMILNMRMISYLSGDYSEASIAFGGIIAYLSAIAIIIAAIISFKESGGITKEKMSEVKEKSMGLTKSAINISNKIAKTAVDEVKKEIDKNKSQK